MKWDPHIPAHHSDSHNTEVDGVKESTWNVTTYNILTKTQRVCFHKQDLLCSILFIQTAYCHIYMYL